MFVKYFRREIDRIMIVDQHCLTCASKRVRGSSGCRYVYHCSVAYNTKIIVIQSWLKTGKVVVKVSCNAKTTTIEKYKTDVISVLVNTLITN